MIHLLKKGRTINPEDIISFTGEKNTKTAPILPLSKVDKMQSDQARKDQIQYHRKIVEAKKQLPKGQKLANQYENLALKSDKPLDFFDPFSKKNYSQKNIRVSTDSKQNLSIKTEIIPKTPQKKKEEIINKPILKVDPSKTKQTEISPNVKKAPQIKQASKKTEVIKTIEYKRKEIKNEEPQIKIVAEKQKISIPVKQKESQIKVSVEKKTIQTPGKKKIQESNNYQKKKQENIKIQEKQIEVKVHTVVKQQKNQIVTPQKKEIQTKNTEERLVKTQRQKMPPKYPTKIKQQIPKLQFTDEINKNTKSSIHLNVSTPKQQKMKEQRNKTEEEDQEDLRYKLAESQQRLFEVQNGIQRTKAQLQIAREQIIDKNRLIIQMKYENSARSFATPERFAYWSLDSNAFYNTSDPVGQILAERRRKLYQIYGTYRIRSITKLSKNSTDHHQESNTFGCYAKNLEIQHQNVQRLKQKMSRKSII